MEGVDKARRAVLAASDPADESMKRFHATTEQASRSFFKPRLDDPVIHAGLNELLSEDSKLGDLFALACGGDDAVFYDYNALRTEPGCARQPVLWRRLVFDFTMACRGDGVQIWPPHRLRAVDSTRSPEMRAAPRMPSPHAQVHFDTPFQETPPLFTAFVALQTVTAAMGAPLCINQILAAARTRLTGFMHRRHALSPGNAPPVPLAVRIRREPRWHGAARRDAARGRRAVCAARAGRRHDLRYASAALRHEEPGRRRGRADPPIPVWKSTSESGSAPRISFLHTGYFLNFTFCNPRADQSDLGHVPCIRPGYERRMTLRDARAELLCPSPFAALGDGL